MCRVRVGAQVKTIGQDGGCVTVGKVEEQEGNAGLECCDALCVEEELDCTLIARFWGGIGWRRGSGRLIVCDGGTLWLGL